MPPSTPSYSTSGDGPPAHTSKAWVATTDCRTGLPSSIATSRLPDAPSPLHKLLEELADEILRRCIRQVAFLIKTSSSVADHHFGLVDGEHIEVHENLAQVVLRPRGADGPERCAHDRRRLPVPRAVAVGARRPVNRILQHAGHGVVVFRRHKQNGVRLAYPPLQLRDFGGRVLLLVLVKDRDTVKCECFQNRAFGYECGGGAQGGAVV